jgi:hypothetical protein
MNTPTPRVSPRQRAAERRAHLDELLDEAIAETYPASDPVAISFDVDALAPPVDAPGDANATPDASRSGALPGKPR